METIRGVLLDIDGTLVDSNEAHARAWVAAMSERGVHRRHDEVRRLIGMGGDKLVPSLTDLAPGSPELEALGARRSELFRAHYLPSVRAFPGARPLLERMKRDGLRLVAASSAKRDELDALLAIAGATGLLDDATSADDVARSKPDPDIVQAAVARAGLAPWQVVMVGDTPYDVEASLRAGVRIIALRCGGWEDRALRGAAEIYDGPADLLTRYDTSLLARA
jgi:HAD superfamily hydrolase (TIGR01509 family)